YDQALADMVNALIIVATFIAGVQAQMLSFTYESNDTHLQAATNWLGFVGLTLDILGATAGVAHAIILKQSIKDARDVATLLNTLASEMDRLELVQQPTVKSEPERFDQYEGALAAVGGWMEIQYKFSSRFPLVRYIKRWTAYIQGTRLLPISAMGGGALCLLLSVLCFAASTQRRFVWISCATFAALTVVWSLLPGASEMRRIRAARLQGVKESLEELKASLAETGASLRKETGAHLPYLGNGGDS
ncbi:hypothetical protein FA95DRAFT_1611166, partial [Auriscalpium vulgare]